jgi:hypothetical protein
MALIINETLTANTLNTKAWALRNTRGNRNIYTVHATGTFGSGTLTFFTNSQGVTAAQAATTHDVAILNNGLAVSMTSNGSFDFECNSDPTHPTAFKVILAGATNPSIVLTVSNVA